MKKITLLVLVLSCVSCGLVPRKEYAGPKKPNDEIAIIKGYYPGLMKDGLYSRISGYSEIKDGKPNQFKETGNSTTGFPNEIQLLPGKYIIQAYCGRENMYSYPYAAVDAEAGNTYILKCEAIPREPNEAIKTRLFIDSVFSSSNKK